MIWLSILGSETLLVIAETLLIIVGSMLMGILLSWLFWGGQRQQVEDLQQYIADEKRNAEELRDQQNELLQIREHLKNEIAELRLKTDAQSRTIFDLHQNLSAKEVDERHQKGIIDGLNATIDSYQRRIHIIEEELTQAKNAVLIPHKSQPNVTLRANYEHVSQLLGKQVTENDLTIVTGIGPKTAALLQSNGINTWADLAKTEVDALRNILVQAGGIYKSIDPSAWPRQALMAAQSEWRKLRIFQGQLKKED